MTMTETAPATGSTNEEPITTDYGFLASIVGTGEHSRIGRYFIRGGLLGLVSTLVVGLLLDIERLSPKTVKILDSDVLTQMVSAHRLGLVLLFAIPMFLGIAISVVPLQVGATTVAFPRLAALGLWTWGAGVILWLAGYLMGGGPGGGDLQGTDLWLLSVIMIVAGLLAATISVMTTVLGLRTTGMTLARTPHFAFSMLVAGSIWVLTLPVLVANLVLIYVDHRYGQVLWGSAEGILAQLSWLVGQPQIYAIAIPVLGFAAEVIPVFSGARERFYGALQVALGVFGFAAVGSWAQFAASSRIGGEEMPLLTDPLYIAVGVIALVPVLLFLVVSVDTMMGGKAKPSVPFVAGLLSLLVLLVATVVGVLNVVEPLELFGTSAMLGQFSLTVGAAVIAAIGALWYWAPKLFGATMPEAPGKLFALAAALGALLAGIGFTAGGFLDQPDSPNPGAVKDAVELFNLVGVAGTALLLLGAVGTLAVCLTGKKTGGVADNPWGGHTLEWATTSPPPVGNFPGPIEVTNERPLLVDDEEVTA